MPREAAASEASWQEHGVVEIADEEGAESGKEVEKGGEMRLVDASVTHVRL